MSITPPVFDFIYTKKIEEHLENAQRFTFQDMNILFTAYEYWRFERKHQHEKIFQNLERDNVLDLDDAAGAEKVG